MKKFLGILVIAGALVACNNSGDATNSNDSTVVDTITSAPDTLKVDTTGVVVDTTKRAADTLKK